MNITEATLTDRQLDDAPSARELEIEDELRRRLAARRPIRLEDQPAWNQDPWAS